MDSGGFPHDSSASRPTSPRRRLPAALVLGGLTGLLAAVAVLPTIAPITQQIASAQAVSELSQAHVAARAAAMLADRSIEPTPAMVRRLGLDGMRIIDRAGEPLVELGAWPDATEAELCPPGEPVARLVRKDGVEWAVACEEAGPGLVITARHLTEEPAGEVGLMVVGLAVMVGISTALGVLQVLSPLSRINTALARVSSGERGVEVASTGLAELDELVDRLNTAAKAVEDRQDAVQARMAVVQEMARVVAHEIRNPLQSLEFLSALIIEEEEREERESLANSIRDEVRALEAVVSRLLRRDKRQGLRVRRQRTPVAELMHRAVSFRDAEARHRGVQLKTGMVVDVDLSVDRTLLSRALENLIANALHFAELGTGRVVVASQVIDGMLVLTVDDSGPGVPPELADAVFQPDVSTREGGTGLGLALVQGVAQAHGGHVDHVSSPLGGARFRIFIPLEPPEDDADEPSVG